LKEELNNSTVAKFATVQNEGGIIMYELTKTEWKLL